MEQPLIEIGGGVAQPRAYDFAALAALPGQIDDISALVSGREGGAVRLAPLIDAAGPGADTHYITLYADGDYSASVPLRAVLDQAVLIYRLDDGPLPREQGGPVRFFIIDVAACQTADVDACANVKYLRRIELSAEQGRDVRPKTLAQHMDLHR